MGKTYILAQTEVPLAGGDTYPCLVLFKPYNLETPFYVSEGRDFVFNAGDFSAEGLLHPGFDELFHYTYLGWIKPLLARIASGEFPTAAELEREVVTAYRQAVDCYPTEYIEPVLPPPAPRQLKPEPRRESPKKAPILLPGITENPEGGR